MTSNFFAPEIETASRERIRALQLEKLKNQVAWAYDRVPWYKARFQERGLTPADIRSLADIARLPFTDKQVLRDTYPYGLRAVAACAGHRLDIRAAGQIRPCIDCPGATGQCIGAAAGHNAFPVHLRSQGSRALVHD
ncbi:hypothetical protein FACS189497_13820 [Betaproteobacteria bacterium]|nr:hypothetical protein FACS189497_13820 [Betaproteobacteria bacterium]